jgi:hypothetical protein
VLSSLEIAIVMAVTPILAGLLFGDASPVDQALSTAGSVSDFDQWYYSNRDMILDEWSKAISGLDTSDSTVDWTAALPELWNKTMQRLYQAELPWASETVVGTDVVVTENPGLADEAGGDSVVNEALSSFTDGSISEQVAAASDLEAIATEPVVAIEPLSNQTYSMVVNCFVLPISEILSIGIAEPSEIKTFPPSGESGLVDVGDQATLVTYLPEGVSLMVGGNPNTVGDFGLSLGLQHLEELPTDIRLSGEALTIDSGDLVRSCAPIDTPPVSAPPENLLGGIDLEMTETVVATDPLIPPTYPIAAICYAYNPVDYSYSGSIDWEIKIFSASGEPELLNAEVKAALADPVVAPGDPLDLMGHDGTVEDHGLSPTLLPACLDYPVPEGEPAVGETTDAPREPEPRTGIWLRGELHTMDSGALVRPVSPIATSPFTAPPENLRSTTAVGGTELPKGTEAVAEAPPAPGMAPAISLQPPVAQAAVDPITGNAAWAQPTGLIQPSFEAGRNLADDPVLVATPPPAGSDSPRGSGFPFAQAYPASLAVPNRQGSSETLPVTSGSATPEGIAPATTSTLISLTAGLGSSVRDPFVIGWGVESVIPTLIADVIPFLILI